MVFVLRVAGIRPFKELPTIFTRTKVHAHVGGPSIGAWRMYLAWFSFSSLKCSLQITRFSLVPTQINFCASDIYCLGKLKNQEIVEIFTFMVSSLQKIYAGVLFPRPIWGSKAPPTSLNERAAGSSSDLYMGVALAYWGMELQRRWGRECMLVYWKMDSNLWQSLMEGKSDCIKFCRT